MLFKSLHLLSRSAILSYPSSNNARREGECIVKILNLNTNAYYVTYFFFRSPTTDATRLIVLTMKPEHDPPSRILYSCLLFRYMSMEIEQGKRPTLIPFASEGSQSQGGHSLNFSYVLYLLYKNDG